MARSSVQLARLGFKKAFASYFVTLNSPAIADPTEAFAAAEEYLRALRDQLGAEEFTRRLDAEAAELAGQIEQDLRRKWRDRPDELDFSDLEERLRDCFEHGLSALDTPRTQPR